MTHILIDMGKTFRSSALNWFPQLGVKSIKALFLTHDHADALGGLDDVRDIQGPFEYIHQDNGHVVYASNNKMPIYLSEKTMESCRQSFAYIVEASMAEAAVARKVAMCDFRQYDGLEGARRDERDPNLVYGFKTICGRVRIDLLPVYHGDGYVCMGFAFSGLKSNCAQIVFLSDVSSFPEETIRAIDQKMPIDTLIIDSLFYSNPHFSHLCVEEVLDFVSRWRPRQTLIIGYSCRTEWRSTNETLKNKVVPSMRDGSRIPNFMPPLERPIRTAKMLAGIPLPTTQPDLTNIESIQLARDGLLLPFDW